jgi:hypothetical protein
MGRRTIRVPSAPGQVKAEQGWCLLIHQLPAKPLYLRARIRQRLERVGAVAIKNAVYLLPQTPPCREDLQWVAQEAVAAGGEAYVCDATFVFGLADADLEERFRRARATDYEEIVATARETLSRLRRSGRREREEDPPSRLRRLKKRLQQVEKIDFFGAPERAQAEAAVRALEHRLQPADEGTRGRRRHPHAELVGKTWVTRKGVHVDRIATAWLIRRFVDPAAQFRFVDGRQSPPLEGEIRFDMVGGDFTHEGDCCSFETLARHLGLADAALRSVAEIVHDIDLKDGKFDRDEAAGIEQLVNGLCRTCPADEERLDKGGQLFDDLYRSFTRPAEKRVASRSKGNRTGR